MTKLSETETPNGLTIGHPRLHCRLIEVGGKLLIQLRAEPPATITPEDLAELFRKAADHDEPQGH